MECKSDNAMAMRVKCVCVVCLSYFEHAKYADEAVGYYILLVAAARLQCFKVGNWSRTFQLQIYSLLWCREPARDTV
jgi:hypothetical protein